MDHGFGEALLEICLDRYLHRIQRILLIQLHLFRQPLQLRLSHRLQQGQRAVLLHDLCGACPVPHAIVHRARFRIRYPGILLGGGFLHGLRLRGIPGLHLLHLVVPNDRRYKILPLLRDPRPLPLHLLRTLGGEPRHGDLPDQHIPLPFGIPHHPHVLSQLPDAFNRDVLILEGGIHFILGLSYEGCVELRCRRGLGGYLLIYRGRCLPRHRRCLSLGLVILSHLCLDGGQRVVGCLEPGYVMQGLPPVEHHLAAPGFFVGPLNRPPHDRALLGSEVRLLRRLCGLGRLGCGQLLLHRNPALLLCYPLLLQLRLIVLIRHGLGHVRYLIRVCILPVPTGQHLHQLLLVLGRECRVKGLLLRF